MADIGFQHGLVEGRLLRGVLRGASRGKQKRGRDGKQQRSGHALSIVRQERWTGRIIQTMRRWLTRRMPIPVLSLIATWAFFSEYVPPFKRVHLFSDIEVYHYPLQRYAFQALKEGRFPQWDPSMYCGISFAGKIQAAVFYPPMWLVYAANWRHQVLPFKALE